VRAICARRPRGGPGCAWARAAVAAKLGRVRHPRTRFYRLSLASMLASCRSRRRSPSTGGSTRGDRSRGQGDPRRNVGFWFRFTPANLGSLVRTIWTKR
jgi:hypothetical protein